MAERARGQLQAALSLLVKSSSLLWASGGGAAEPASAVIVAAPSVSTDLSCGVICLPESWLSWVAQLDAADRRSVMACATVAWSPEASAAWACAALPLMSETCELLSDFASVQTWAWSA